MGPFPEVNNTRSSLIERSSRHSNHDSPCARVLLMVSMIPDNLGRESTATLPPSGIHFEINLLRYAISEV